ncbi:MAG: hypothetical protein V1802_02780 [Candidatus Aenigmatarchaeota archaeon]
METEVIKVVDVIVEKLGVEFIDKFINIYNDLGKAYLKFIKIDRENKTHQEIADITGVGRVTITEWIRYNQIPWSIKAILEIYNKKFHKIPWHVLARIIGWGMGDGGIDKRPHYFFFCSGKKDLEKAKLYIEKYTKLKSYMKRNKTVGNFTKYDGKIKNFSGDNWILRISDTSFARFLCALGLPKGSKVTQEFLIPEWIFNGNKQVKKEFISALFECELERFRLQYQEKKTYTKVIINAPIFGMCKIEKYTQNLNEFLNQIRYMTAEFDIKTSSLSMPIKSNLRKDGNITYFVRFNVRSSSENILKFSETIDLKFNRDKRETLKVVVKEAKKKIERELDIVEKYNKSQILFEKGYNFSEIARELGITHPTAKQWVIIKNHLPRRIEK